MDDTGTVEWSAFTSPIDQASINITSVWHKFSNDELSNLKVCDIHFTLNVRSMQAVMVADGVNSYAIFIYGCGVAGLYTIAPSEMFSNHGLSGSLCITSIGCLNNPDNQFFTVLYMITNSTEDKKFDFVTTETY